MAVNTYLVNTDGYIANPSRNYALYMNEKGRITIIPWDYNMILGAYGLNDINDVINFDIYNPIVDNKIKDKPLLNVILGNKNYLKKYNEYLKDITKIATEGGTTSFGKNYNKNNLEKIINNYSELLIQEEKNNPQSFYNMAQVKEATNNIKEVLHLRSESVLNQINKKGEKIYSSIDLRTMGGLNLK